MRLAIRSIGLSATLLAVLAGQASAATAVGQTAPSAADTFNCGGGSPFLTPAVAPGTPSYQVPTGGVLTSWSVQGGTLLAPGTLKLKLVRPAGPNAWEVVSEDPTLRSVPPTVLSTFSVQIPVSAGEFLALWVPGGVNAPCSYETVENSNLQVWRGGGPHPEPAVGQTFPTDQTDVGFRTNVRAVVEADCDADGLGDETQDSDTSSCNPPPPPPPPPPDTEPPEARITKGAPNKTTKHKVKFKFRSNEPGSTFACKKDKKPWKPCTSPTRMKRLDEGKHKFKVRATDPAGNTGRPDTDKFKVVG
jgi:hypothetical protein